MAFRDAPPRVYVPKRDKSTSQILLILTIIVIIIIGVVLLFSIRRISDVKCITNFDCASPNNICDRDSGVCVECKSSYNCGPGLICSTANTCV